MTKVFHSSAYIIQEALSELRPLGYKATVFQTWARMPSALKGLPDLYLMKDGVSYWIEVKARHANYMRDQMHDAQWQWFHDRKKDFNFFLRYAIVADADELVEWVEAETVMEGPHMSIYHYARYEKWLEEK